MSSKKQTRNKLAELSRDSFYAFLRSSPTAEGKKFKHTKFHEYLAYTLQGVAHDTLVNQKSRWVLLSVPPRHGKTYTTCQSFPAWCFGAYQKQVPKFIVTSYSPTMTAESGGNARSIINSPFYRSVFPDVNLRVDKKSKLNFGIDGGGSFFGTGVGSPVTGFGANILLIDDPYKGRREAESATIQRDVQEYFESTLLSRIEANGSLVVIMQRWNQNDLVQFIIDNHPKWKKKNPELPELEIISFPAIAEEDEYYPSGKLFREAGESLAPEVGYTVKEMLGKKATMDPYYWFSQYQQNPIDKSAATFKKEMFRHYTPADIKGKFLVYYTFIDPAISKKEGADELVILTLGYDVENDYVYRIHETAGHYEPEEFYRVLYDEHLSKYKIKELIIEAESFQQVYRFGIEKLRDRIRGGFVIKEFRGKRLRGGNNKEMRIEGLLGFYQRGVILHRDFGDEKYEEQLLTFPNGRHDDRIDCMSFFPEFMVPKYSRDVEVDQMPLDAFDFSFTPR